MNRTQSVRVGCALSLLVGLVGGFLLFTWYRDILSCHGDTPPLLRLNVTIDPSQDRQLIEQSRQFAFKHNFRLDIGPSDPQRDNFRVRMIRRDVEIITRIPSNPGGYEVVFYNYDCIHPIVASDIADLVNDFKSFMSEVPNVTITEVK